MRDNSCPVSTACIVKQDRVLRLAQSRGLSMPLIESLTGIPVDTLRSYTDRPSRPAQMMPYSAVIKLLKALPDDLAQHLIEEAEYTLKPVTCRAKDWLEMGERATTLASKILRFERSDGRIDHREDAELSADLRAFAADAQSMMIA